MTFPQDLAARNQYILDAVKQNDFEHTWISLGEGLRPSGYLNEQVVRIELVIIFVCCDHELTAGASLNII